LSEKHKFRAVCFSYTHKPNIRLYFCGFSIAAFNYNINYNPTYCDDKIALNCWIISKKHSVYTPTGNRVKIWSTLTGEVLKVFTEITRKNSDITAFILDKLKKRVIVGDQ